ncbi:uncharacterized protein G2W53_022692 [Senna tora]|uniref:Uncharacterized protein n=1 Tax=Senna tora TaxID=362788 RepID=A0A834TLK8_9FABA|nr:uncharacterized protein G2W53_022692 [Senna tora]
MPLMTTMRVSIAVDVRDDFIMRTRHDVAIIIAYQTKLCYENMERKSSTHFSTIMQSS